METGDAYGVGIADADEDAGEGGGGGCDSVSREVSTELVRRVHRAWRGGSEVLGGDGAEGLRY